MLDLLINYLCRIIITLIILVPAITGILVAGTIIYNQDFKKHNESASKETDHPELKTYTEKREETKKEEDNSQS